MLPSPAIIYQGGKYRIAPWIISFFPPHEIYLEPFGGAASVLLNKPRCQTEVYNDLDKRVYMVFKIMQNKKKAKELYRRLFWTPYSREAYEQAYSNDEPEDEIEIAWRTIVRSHMSNGANGATAKRKLGFQHKLDSARKRICNAKKWQKYFDSIILFHERLKGVILENTDAIKLIKYFDGPGTLHYVDPPYVNNTWNSSDKYRCMVDLEYHQELLKTLKFCKGFVVLSGYDNELYRKELADWKVFQKKTINQHSQARTECVWINENVAQTRSASLLTIIEEGYCDKTGNTNNQG